MEGAGVAKSSALCDCPALHMERAARASPVGPAACGSAVASTPRLASAAATRAASCERMSSKDLRASVSSLPPLRKEPRFARRSTPSTEAHCTMCQPWPEEREWGRADGSNSVMKHGTAVELQGSNPKAHACRQIEGSMHCAHARSCVQVRRE